MKINHRITACRYGIFTDKFENYVFKFSHENEHVTIETYFENRTYRCNKLITILLLLLLLFILK